MVDNHPLALAILEKREAVASRKRLGFPILHIGKGIVAGIDGGAAVHPDQLLSERHLEAWQYLERRYEIVAQRSSIRSHGRGECSPEDRIGGIEGNHLIGIVLTQGFAPL